MTLDEAAGKARERNRDTGCEDTVHGVLLALEADTEWKLPERIAAFVEELETVQAASDLEAGPSSGPPKAWPLMMAGDVARRLREIREGKP
ncbi:MAG: hypothetical protein IVW52_04895 [Acidimicrobiales bacterium]|nr:hypothetical protein [Acidimicrobiales bacterium]